MPACGKPYSYRFNIRPCSNRIMGVDHHPHKCESIGDLPVRARGDDGSEYHLLIRNVRYAPTFKDSLISINQLWLESKVDVTFKDLCCLITRCGKRFPFDKPKATGLYTWRVLSNATKQTRMSSTAEDKTSVRPSVNRTTVPCIPATATGTASSLSFQATHSSKSVSHIASLAPDVAARHMHRRLHLGARRMNLLPSLTADAPVNLSRAGSVHRPW